MRAELQCLCYGHCGMDAELPDFVGSRTDDSPGTASANDDRFAAQFRMVFLLNGSVKCVHVHMYKPLLHISSCPYSIYFPDSFCVVSFC